MRGSHWHFWHHTSEMDSQCRISDLFVCPCLDMYTFNCAVHRITLSLNSVWVGVDCGLRVVISSYILQLHSLHSLHTDGLLCSVKNGLICTNTFESTCVFEKDFFLPCGSWLQCLSWVWKRQSICLPSTPIVISHSLSSSNQNLPHNNSPLNLPTHNMKWRPRQHTNDPT